MSWVHDVGVRVAFWGVVAALGVGVAGCASSGGGGQNSAVAGQSGGGGETAPQAWNRLDGESKLGGILGTVTGHREFGLLEMEQKNADTEVGKAMQSPLPIEALDAMVDEVAQKMVKTIPDVPEVKNSKNQLILAFATLGDGTGSGNPRLAEALDSLRNKLSKSEKMTNNFVFVTTTETDANALGKKIAGNDTSAFRDPLQRTADNTQAVVYDPAAIFLITGSLHNSSDTVHHTVRIDLSLLFNHVQSRRMVANDQFIRTYMWHPTKHNWELQP